MFVRMHLEGVSLPGEKRDVGHGQNPSWLSERACLRCRLLENYMNVVPSAQYLDPAT